MLKILNHKVFKKNITFLLLLFSSFLLFPVTDMSFLGNSFIGHFCVALLWTGFFYHLNKFKLEHLAYLGLLTFFMYIKTENINFQNYSFKTGFNVSLLIFIVVMSINFIFDHLKVLKTNKLIFTLLLAFIFITVNVPALITLLYIFNFKAPFKEVELFALFQTNIAESVEFISMFYQPGSIALLILFLLSIFYLSKICVSHKIKYKSNINYSLYFVIFIIYVIYVSVLYASDKPRKSYFFFETFNLFGKSVIKYDRELILFKEATQKRKVNKDIFNQTKLDHETNGTFIVIIGESTNKKHSSLYGYPRETRPELNSLYQNKELILLENMYSTHTHTVPVMEYAFTQANKYSKKSFYNSPSIIELLNNTNYETIWLTNQNLLGAWDNKTSIIANESSHLKGYNGHIGKTTDTQSLDEVLLEPVKDRISTKSDKSSAVFIHLMGTHWRYKSRYSPNYKKFPQQDKQTLQGLLGKIAKNEQLMESINHYDNAILYNDFIVSEIINMAKRSKLVDGVFFFSDHADDVIAELGHNSGKYSYYMSEIPAFFWFSDHYKKNHTKKIDTLIENRKKLISNDLIYDTLVDFFGIKTNLYNKNYSLLSDTFNLPESEAVVLKKGRKYAREDNHLYWQRKNSEKLIQEGLDSKFFPHRVNSIGKLREIWSNGLRAFEIDLRFNDNQDNKFYVGHNPGDMGVDLDTFLNSVDPGKIKKIWFDVKNLENTNYKALYNELNRLDKIYKLKDKVIFETSNTNPIVINLFSKAGWQTSYYLPTKIHKTIKEKNEKKLNIRADKLLNIVKKANFSAISFDHRLYDFVKQKMYSRLPSKINVHVWYGPHFKNNHFFDTLNNKEIYRDKKIKTFLCPYQSQFDL